MPWTPKVWDGSGYAAPERDGMITTILEGLQNWIDPMTEPARSRFPWYATLGQTLSLRTAIKRGLIPMTASGVSTWLANGNGTGGDAAALYQEGTDTALYLLWKERLDAGADQYDMNDAILRAWLVQELVAGGKDAYFASMDPSYSYKPAGYLKAFEIANWASDANMLAERVGYPLPFLPGTATVAPGGLLNLPARTDYKSQGLITLSTGMQFWKALVAEGPTEFPDGMNLILLKDGSNYGWDGPRYVPYVNVDASPSTCSYQRGTGPWYLVGAAGGTCPAPPVGWTGGFPMPSARMLAAASRGFGRDEFKPTPGYTHPGASPLIDAVGGGSFGTSPTFDPPATEVVPVYTQPIILYAPDPTNPLTAVPGTNPLTPGAPVIDKTIVTYGDHLPTPLTPGVGHNPLTPSIGPNAQPPGVTGDASGGAPGASGGISLPLVVGVGVLAFLASRKGRGTRTWGG